MDEHQEQSLAAAMPENNASTLHVEASENKLTAHHSSVKWVSVLPPPEVLSAYADICAESLSVILRMAETEQANRHKRTCEEQEIRKRDQNVQTLSLICACIVVLSTFAFGAWALWLGMPLTGLASFLAALGTMVGSAIWRERTIKRHKESRKQEE